jgi:hypothetical protein
MISLESVMSQSAGEIITKDPEVLGEHQYFAALVFHLSPSCSTSKLVKLWTSSLTTFQP